MTFLTLETNSTVLGSMTWMPVLWGEEEQASYYKSEIGRALFPESIRGARVTPPPF